MPRLSQFLAQAAAEQGRCDVQAAAKVASHSEQAPDGARQQAEQVQRQYQRRCAERGERAYRHPDGSLRPKPPAPNPYAVVSLGHPQQRIQQAAASPGR
jgi:hypothetical protein